MAGELCMSLAVETDKDYARFRIHKPQCIYKSLCRLDKEQIRLTQAWLSPNPPEPPRG